MMNPMMNANYANMAAMLAEDVCAPELRSPRNGGMRKTGKCLFGFLFRSAVR